MKCFICKAKIEESEDAVAILCDSGVWKKAQYFIEHHRHLNPNLRSNCPGDANARNVLALHSKSRKSRRSAPRRSP